MSDYYNNPNDGCLDWGDAIENDGQEFIVLPEGDYFFTVIDMERGRHNGSAKIPACNKATLTLEVRTSNGVARIRTDLILYRSMEWRISAFFRCIGQKKKGERLIMDWNNVTGLMGRAHFKPRTYIGNDGMERTVNDLDRFLDYDPQVMKAAGPQYAEDDEEIPF